MRCAAFCLSSSSLSSIPQLTRSKRREHKSGHSGPLDLASTLSRFGYSTGFDTVKYIEEFYSAQPISASVEQREELAARRDLCSDALKSYVTAHYSSFIATSTEITAIESDMLRLNNLLAQFQLGLRTMQSAPLQFQFDDERMQKQLKQIEQTAAAANAHGGAAGSGSDGLLGAATSAATGGQHPAEVDLEERIEELRGLIYERKFESAISTLEQAQDKVKRRAKEIEKTAHQGGGSSGGGAGGAAGSGPALGFESLALASPGAGGAALGWGGAVSGSAGSGASAGAAGAANGGPTPFQQMCVDLLSLRQTLIEMLFSELRAAATASQSVIASSRAAASTTGSKSKGSSSSSSRSGGGGNSASAFQLSSIVGHLLHLRQSRKTLQVWLYHVKSTHLRSSIKSIKFTGDILAYISELSLKFFGGIAATTIEFTQLFKQQPTATKSGGSSGGANTADSSGSSNETADNPLSLTSYFVRWILFELSNTFNHIFQKQVFQSEGTFSKLGRCLRYAFQACQSLEARTNSAGGSGSLSNTGLNLSFVLSRMFTPSLIDVIGKNYAHVDQLILEELQVENWRVSELWVTEKERGGGAGAGAGADAAGTMGGRNRTASIGGPGSSSSTLGAPAFRKKRALKLTSSAKYLYDVVRNLLRELVPILDQGLGSFPELRVDLYPTVVAGMMGLFENYFMTMISELRGGIFGGNTSGTPMANGSSGSNNGQAQQGSGRGIDEVQALSIMANAFYLNDDLLPRVIKEFRKQFCAQSSSGSSSNSGSVTAAAGAGGSASIPELEEFNAKLYKLYGALRSSFCVKRATLMWPFDPILLPTSNGGPPTPASGSLKFLSKLVGGTNRYGNPMGLVSSGELALVSPEWVDFTEHYLPGLKHNVARCLNAQEVEPILRQAITELMETIKEGQFQTNSQASREAQAAAKGGAAASGPAASVPAGCIWSSYLFGLGGLQQFVFDLKFFIRSCGGRIASVAGAGQTSPSSGGGASDASLSPSSASSKACALDEVAPGGFVTTRAADATSALLRRCISSYSSKTATRADEAWMKQTFGWIENAVEKRVAKCPTINLAKGYAMDKEKVTREGTEGKRVCARVELKRLAVRSPLWYALCVCCAPSGACGSREGS